MAAPSISEKSMTAKIRDTTDIEFDVYKCPYCGNPTIDPEPSIEAKAQQQLGYERWKAQGQPEQIPGKPCWNCPPRKIGEMQPRGIDASDKMA